MPAAAPAPIAGEAAPKQRRVAVTCRDCGHPFVRRVRTGHHVTCPKCGVTQPGPERQRELEQLAGELADRRRRDRERKAAARASSDALPSDTGPAGPDPGRPHPPPRPRRSQPESLPARPRRRTTGRRSPQPAGTPPPAPPATPPPVDEGHPRPGFIQRLLSGAWEGRE